MKDTKCKTVISYSLHVPKVVIEVDTKASIKDLKEPTTYFHTKTDQLLDFGVEKVIWIFTDSQKIMIAGQHKNWEIQSWDLDLEVLEGIVVNVGGLVEEEF